MLALAFAVLLSVQPSSLPKATPAAHNLSFIRNDGQWDSRAKFLASSPGIDMWVTDSGVTLDFNVNSQDRRKGHVVQVQFAGSTDGRSVGYGPQQRRVSYLSGDQSSDLSAPTFSEAWVKEVGAGVDARYYFDSGRPRYDLVVQPGGDPSEIAMKLAGASNVRVGSDNRLRYDTSLGTVVEQGLFAYQKAGSGVVSVPARPIVGRDGTVSFQVGAYDRTKPLIIDPVIAAPNTIGSLAGGALGSAVASGDGTSVIVGTTFSSTFPATPGAYDVTFDGTDGLTRNGFVAKVDSDGNALWTTYFGKNLHLYGVALDSTNQPVIVGSAVRRSFEPTPGAYDVEFNGDLDGFAAKLSADGSSLLWATVIGGFTNDEARAVTVGADDKVYLTGLGSSAYPVTTGALDEEYNFNGDVVVSVLSSDGSSLLASTYVGSPQLDYANAISLDSAGNVVIAGRTGRRFYPVSATGVLDSTYGGTSEGFVTKLSADLATLQWSTFVGGDTDDAVESIAIGSDDSVVVGGRTTSATGFTGLSGSLRGSADAFVLKINGDGSAASMPATGLYVGGDGAETLGSVGIVQNSLIIVAGGSDSTSGLEGLTTVDGVFPTRSAGDAAGEHDTFVTLLSSDALTNTYGTFFGMDGDDSGLWITAHGISTHVFSHANVGGTSQALVTKFVLSTKLSELTLDKQTVVGTPGPLGQITGKVKLNSVTSTALDVALSSANANASVPATVTIPAGSREATFTVNTAATSDATVGDITATLVDVTLHAEVTVTPVEISLSLAKESIVANFGRKVGAKITLNQAVDHDVVVALASSDIKAKVPPSVTVLAGNSEGAFLVTSGNALVEPVSVNIDATHGNTTSTAVLNLLPPDIASVTISPDTIKGFDKSIVTVTFNSPIPPDGQVLPRKLVWAEGTSAGNVVGTKIAAFIGTNVASAGSLSYTCEVQGKPSLRDNRVYAQFGNVSSNVLTILRPRVESVLASPETGPGPRTLSGSVILDSVAPTGGMTVFITKTGGENVILPSTTLTVPEGKKRVDFTFNVLAVGQDRTYTISSRVNSADTLITKPFTINAPTIKTVVVGGGGAKAGATFNLRVAISSEARIGGLKIALAETGSSFLSLPIDPETGNPGIEIDGGTMAKTVPVTIAAGTPAGTVITGTATLNGQVVQFEVNVYP